MFLSISQGIFNLDEPSETEIIAEFGAQSNLHSIYPKAFTMQSQWTENNNVWSQPEQLTHPSIQRNEYVAIQGPNNTYHCFWIKKLRIFTNAIYYSYMENLTINKWSLPKQVIQLDSEIKAITAIADRDSNLHLAFISTRENIWQINYISKESQNNIWSSREVFSRSDEYYYTNPIFAISNEDIIHLAWVTKLLNSGSAIIDSAILIKSKNLTTDIWEIQRKLFDSEDPIAFDLAVNQNNTILIGIIKWDLSLTGNLVVMSESNNDTLTWSPVTQIASYTSLLYTVNVYPSIITNGFHVLWNYKDSHKKLFHLELNQNLTIRTSAAQVNLLSTDGYMAGIGENQTTGDLYIIYEESFLGNPNIKQRKRNGIGLVWETANAISIDSLSFNPKYMQNYYSNTSEAVLVNLNKDKIEARVFINPTNYSNATAIMVTSFNNNKGNFVADSKGTYHFVWNYIGPSQVNIYYQKKEVNSSWEFQGSIMTVWKTAAQSPRIAVDSKDNLHCLFVADTNASGIDGLFYVTKNYNQNNWSAPILVKTPGNDAEKDNFVLYIDLVDTIHIVWAETTITFQNKLLYSYKESTDSEFTTENIIINSGPTTSNLPYIVIDSFGTIHLTYTEDNRGSAVNEVDYRYKLTGQSWSAEEVITASIDVDFYRPLLTVDSKDTLRLVYLQKYSTGTFLLSSAELWQKPILSSWTYNSSIFTDELANYHSFLITKDDIMVYTYHVTNLPNDKFENNFQDKIFTYCTDESGEWGSRETLFLNPMYNSEIFGTYDKKTDNIYFIVNDKRQYNSQIHLIYRQNDTDQDLLGDIDELIFWTNKYQQDTDGDLLMDGFEVKVTLTNPAVVDTDWDELPDGMEVNFYLSNPLVIDTDGDSISDGDEVKIWNTSPIDADSDNDNISDFAELFIYHTNPNNADSDYDLMPDYWEILHNLNPNFNDAGFDEDSDNLYNVEEYFHNTDPYNNDTDADELSDGDEVKIWGTDPLKFDTDEDTIGDSDEVLVYHTDPLQEDSDGDGYTDREEINSQTDPNDPRDNIRSRKIKTALIATLTPTCIIIISFIAFETRYRMRIKKLHEEEKEEIALENEKLTLLMESRNSKNKN